MQAAFVTVVSLLAALVAYGCSLALVRRTRAHGPSLDDTWSGPQKFHFTPTPRVGGLAVSLGLLAAVCMQAALAGKIGEWWLVLICVAPGFFWGLIEDYSKRGTVLVRLVLTALSAGLGYVLLDARITFVDVPLLDDALTVTALSFAFTVLAVTGVAHSINIIDGLNGLAGVTGLLACVGLAIVAWIVDDPFVLQASSVLGACILGFLAVNYPRGRIFLGDGGAYLIGLLLAELSVLLVHRNTEVSPWFPLLLLAYPIWETLFSMFRRKRRGKSTGDADALHLHSLFYRRVLRRRRLGRFAPGPVGRNSMASACLWVFPLACLVAAIVLWEQSIALQIGAAVFALLYGWCYRRMVRFRGPRMPRWLRSRADALPAIKFGDS